MFHETLIAAFRQRFPNLHAEFGHPPDAVLTIPPTHVEVGPVCVYDDDAEATVVLGTHTHFHLEPDDRSLSDENAAQWITDAVLDFLNELFADRVAIWSSPDGSGGCKELDSPPRAAEDSINRWYVWSGPLPPLDAKR